MKKIPWTRAWLGAVLLAGVCGCGHNATVSGTITYQGRPVTYGSVIVLSSDKTARSGVIEPDGSFTVEDVHPGQVKIGVISRSPAKTHPHQRPEGTDLEEVRKSWVPLPHKFEDPDKSDLGCIIGPGTVRYDIDLK